MSRCLNCSADHGTYTRYSHGCRCEPCREAKRERYVSARVDATPYIAILGDLYRRGEDISHMAEATGVDRRMIRSVLFGEQSHINRATAERLAKVVVLLPAEVVA